MFNLWNFDDFVINLFPFILEDAYSIPEYMKNIDVEQYSTLFKIAVVLLIAINIFIYRKNKIGEHIEDHFSHFTLSWLSLGYLICTAFFFTGYDTDAFYAMMFDTLGIFMSTYYLYSQYSQTKQTFPLTFWWKPGILAIIDIFCLMNMSPTHVMVMALTQNLLISSWESYQFDRQLKTEP